MPLFAAGISSKAYGVEDDARRRGNNRGDKVPDKRDKP
jgi:hypothetical protein